MSMTCHRKQAAGFTLIELLVVIGIIAILLALLVPSANILLERARELKCASPTPACPGMYRLYG